MPAARVPQDIGAAIRASRRAQGWTQGELADRAEVGRQWLVAVEHGHAGAELGMVLRVLGALGLGLATIESTAAELAAGPGLNVAELAEAVHDELVRGDSIFALRLLARSVADFRELGHLDAPSVRRFLAAPSSTGDHRWDVLVAATFSRECRLAGIAAPSWTRVAPLRSWWFPQDDPVLTARIMQRTPVDLQVKGIWLDAKALESR